MFTLPATATPDKLNSFIVTLLADCAVIKGTRGVAPTGVTVIAGVALKPDKLIVVPPDAIALYTSIAYKLVTFPRYVRVWRIILSVVTVVESSILILKYLKDFKLPVAL
jgi:hypothetical protein